MYGITETTVHVTHHRLTAADLDDPRRAGVIGTPLADLRVHLLDAAGRPVPPGATGEMYVSGAGVATGYLHRPELTAERFLDDPYGPPGTRMYRSGDLARRRPDGTLDYLGRADAQIQLRGFRVEPGEIEAVLAAHPGVARAAVVPRHAGSGALHLVAYTVPSGDAPASPADLRAHAAAHLPEHMVPAACVPVDALPLTANGKLDIQALPDPDFTAAASGTRPTTPEQALVCALFEDVLRLPRESVGVDAGFFDLGGDSCSPPDCWPVCGTRPARRSPSPPCSRRRPLPRSPGGSPYGRRTPCPGRSSARPRAPSACRCPSRRNACGS